MSDPLYRWFWQPPLDGQPGLMMIIDDHPGPDHPDIPMVTENLAMTIRKIESQIPGYVGLFQLHIYCLDIAGLWFQVCVHPETRQYKLNRPDISQGECQRLWDMRENFH